MYLLIHIYIYIYVVFLQQAVLTGVNPSIPIYLITGLSESELQKWKTQHPTALLFQVPLLSPALR